MGQGSFILELASAFEVISNETSIPTEAFCQCCDKVLPFFSYLGSVFYIAKSEFESKKHSLVGVASTLITLDAVLAADKEADTVTIKNSCSRNLHRLMTSFEFILQLLTLLVSDANMTTREAASTAYDATLAEAHTFVVRAGVKAGLLALPSREHFLHSIGETEESAKQNAVAFCKVAEKVIQQINNLYDGKMPQSDVWFWPSG
jgi:hypothetical protein